ncbi:hypothetical protein EDC04DRAFT_2610204 [Pisolithus marmoratus]|nr:hypothetical protein EDC04DRAFT_2610204 [Pisolithus marmoratus]
MALPTPPSTLTSQGRCTFPETPRKPVPEKYAQTSIPIPEPEDPLVNLTYLARPVTQIIDPQSSLRDLIEACIRAAMTDSTDGDASWPLFQPLHKHTQALVDGVCLDLARALVEPDTVMIPKDGESSVLDCGDECNVRKPPTLSQEKSQEKQNWNLFSDIFTSSAKYQLFGKAQLRDMLTHVLAIPMDEALPTPNARKACVLSIWLPQVQRLAAKFLLPVRDRIAFALRHSMTSELGKEGEKGSACDGLKVSRTSHDLSLYQPSTFAPALVERLPSILSNLLAPILILRTQACHALGGCYVLDNIDFLPSTYNTLRSKPLIVRTLRSTLSAADPTHVAHGPMWVLSVLASFIVLLGPKVCADVKLTRVRYIALAYMRPASEIRTHYAKQDNDWVGMQDQDIQPTQKNFLEASSIRLDAIELVKSMIQKGSQACENGMEIVTIFVCFENTGQSWTLNKFLPHSLFSSNLGLLTVEYSGLSSVVKPIFDECSQLTDVRSLTREELSQDWVFDELIELWKIALRCLWMTEKYDLPVREIPFVPTLEFINTTRQDEEALTEQQTEPYEGTPEKDRIIPPAAAFIRPSVAFPSSTENDLEDELAVEASLVTPVVVPPLANVRRQWQLQRRASTEDVVSPTSLLPYLTLSLPHLRGSDSDTLLQTRAKRLKRMEDAELSDTSLRSSLKALEDIVISSRKW